MRHYGGTSYFDSINGVVWYRLWPQDAPRVFFGHIPEPDGACLPHYVSLDGGCVFGGYLKAWDSRDGIVYYVNPKKTYSVNEFTEATEDAPTDDIRKREELVVAGLLRSDRTDDGKLVVYTYSDNCVYDAAWNEVTMNSRGHVFNAKTGEPVSRPFPKFFNLGEKPPVAPEALAWDKPYDVYEKMDGWLGVLYRHDGQFKVSSRGSFHSEGAQWATEFVQKKDLRFLPNEATLCFEIINPAQRIILDYGEMQSLVILAAFNRYTGEEYPRAIVEEWAKQADIPIVRRYENMTLDDLRRIQAEGKGMEGFVIRFHDGVRVKVKTEWYTTRAKIVSRLTPIALWEAMKDGRVQKEFLVGIPEEIRPLAENIQSTLESQYAAILKGIEDYSRPLIKLHGNDRKAIALAMQADGGKSKLGCKFSATFSLLDGDKGKSSLDKAIMGEIYPKNNDFNAFRAEEQETKAAATMFTRREA
jgi:RNA ligase